MVMLPKACHIGEVSTKSDFEYKRRNIHWKVQQRGYRDGDGTRINSNNGELTISAEKEDNLGLAHRNQLSNIESYAPVDVIEISMQIPESAICNKIENSQGQQGKRN